jgi:hypothetical protein
VFKPKICILDLNHQLQPDFSSIETTVRHTSLQWSPGVLGVPHSSRQLKAFAGSGFDANLCADVYNLYVKEIYLVERAFTLLAIISPSRG